VRISAPPEPRRDAAVRPRTPGSRPAPKDHCSNVL
jgi:hypothetical protein